MNRILEYFALVIPKLSGPRVDQPDYKYQKEVSNEHLVYLKDLFNEQRDRQATIEGKTSQLVGQSSVVFSLVALFVPLFYDKFSNTDVLVRLVLVSLFILAFLFYLFTIIHSTRNLSIHKYRYSTGDPKTVLKKSGSKKFIREQISDLIFSIKVNSYSNDQKGTNLILAHRAFSLGNRVLALLALFICILFLFSPKDVSIEEKQLMLLREIEQMHFELQKDLLQRNQEIPDFEIRKDSIK